MSLAAFPPSAVPEVKFDRLNEHYRNVATLARLVLRHGAFEAGRGKVRAPGFLMDMNQVFQEFVTVGLRECLELSEHSFRSDNRLSGEYLVHLDEAGRVRLQPDLSWWDGRVCTFVGDAKYKADEGRAGTERRPVPDAGLCHGAGPRLVKILERPAGQQFARLPSPREESSRQGESAAVPRPVPKLGPFEIGHKSAT